MRPPNDEMASEESEMDNIIGSSESIDTYVAIADYNSEADVAEDLSLHEGQLVEVLDSHNSQRWLIRTKSTPPEEGWVPSNYLEHRGKAVLEKKDSRELPKEAAHRCATREQEALEKRETVLEELIETEKDFIKSLKFVISTYVREFDNPHVPESLRTLRDDLFIILKEIVTFHESVLLSGLQYVGDVAKVGKTFLRLERDFDKHVAYCRDEPEAQTLLASSEAEEYLLQFSQRIGDTDRTLSDYLKLPIQRINKYQLLLKELIKYTARAKEDCSEFQKALDLMMSIPMRAHDLTYLNSVEGYRGNIQKLGRLLRHDSFVLWETEAKGPGKERYLFLFRDRILVTKKEGPIDMPEFVYKDTIKLAEVSFKEQITDDEKRFEFVYYPEFKKPSIIFQAKTPYIKQAWIKEMKELLRTRGGLVELEEIEEEKTPIFIMEVAAEEDFSDSNNRDSAEYFMAPEYEDGTTRPRFKKTTEKVTCIEHETVRFDCKVAGVPKPSVTWMRGGRPIELSEKFVSVQEEETHIFYIKNTVLDDAGYYKARALNINGAISFKAELVVIGGDLKRMIVKRPSRPCTPLGVPIEEDVIPRRPFFETGMKSIGVQVGESAQFKIKVGGYPEPEVKWQRSTILHEKGRLNTSERYHEKEVIKHSEKFKIIRDSEESATLIIENVTIDDTGRYFCEAINELGSVTSQGQLLVEGSDSMMKYDSDYKEELIEVERGEILKIEVGFDGSPMPKASWMCNGRLLYNTERVTIEVVENVARLIINNTEDSDAGTYTLILETDIEKVSIPIIVNVVEPPPGKTQSFKKSESLRKIETFETSQTERLVETSTGGKDIERYDSITTSEFSEKTEICQEKSTKELNEVISKKDREIIQNAEDSEIVEILKEYEIVNGIKESEISESQKEISTSMERSDYTETSETKEVKGSDLLETEKTGRSIQIIKKDEVLEMEEDYDSKETEKEFEFIETETEIETKKYFEDIESLKSEEESESKEYEVIETKRKSEIDEVYSDSELIETVIKDERESLEKKIEIIETDKRPGTREIVECELGEIIETVEKIKKFQREFQSEDSDNNEEIINESIVTQKFPEPQIKEIVRDIKIHESFEDYEISETGKQSEFNKFSKESEIIERFTDSQGTIKQEKYESTDTKTAEKVQQLTSEVVDRTDVTEREDMFDYSFDKRYREREFGPPGPPTEFQVIDVTPDSVTLRWRPPNFDGGSMIYGYIVEKRGVGRQTWNRAVVSKELSCTVQNLLEDNEYEFSVSAENEYGLGDRAETLSIVAKYPFGVPEPPSQPRVQVISNTSAVLTWTPPGKDGGSPVIGYYAERRHNYSTQWIKMNREMVVDPAYNVVDMIKDANYEFRIIAINKAGESIPGIPSLPVKAIAPLEDVELGEIIRKPAPTFTDDAASEKVLPSYTCDEMYLEEIKLAKGELLKLQVQTKGNPLPKATWSFGERRLSDSYLISIDTTRERTTLKVRNVTKGDSGPYTLNLENEVGKAQAQFLVQVLDVPGPPRNIRVVEGTDDSVTLAWEPPEDDGGAAIEGYFLEKRGIGRRTWQKVDTTEETVFTIPNLVEGNDYEFRIAAENMFGLGEPMDMRRTITVRYTFHEPGPPTNATIVRVSADSVVVTWMPPNTDGGSPILGYYIERRQGISPRWIRISKERINDNVFEVIGLQTGEEYEFRVIAENKAGESRPSMPTDQIVTVDQSDFYQDDIIKEIISVQSEEDRQLIESIEASRIEKEIEDIQVVKDLSPEAPIQVPPKCIPKEEIVCIECGDTFAIDVSIEGEPTPKIYWYLNGKPLLETYRITIEKTQTSSSINIQETSKEDAGTYKIVLESKAGKAEASITAKVLDVPDSPTNVKVQDITNDSVTLQWEPPKDDGGSEIIGYLIEKRGTGRRLFQKVTTTKETTFTVTDLIEDNFYDLQVTAVNKYGTGTPVEVGPIRIKFTFSQPAEVGPPTVERITGTTAVISWNKPSDNGGTILGYYIERRASISPRWIRITKERITDTKCEVSGLVEGEEYEFRIIAENRAGESKPGIPCEPIIAIDSNVEPVTEQVNKIITDDVRESQLIKETVDDSQVIEEKRIEETRVVQTTVIREESTVEEVRETSFSQTIHVKEEEEMTGVLDESIITEEALVSIQPSPPVVERITATSALLTWQAPPNRAVLGYHVEQRKGIETVWMRITKERLSDTSYVVENLEVDEEYQFRIISETELGESKPSEPSKPIKAKETFVEQTKESISITEQIKVEQTTEVVRESITTEEAITSIQPGPPLVQRISSTSALLTWQASPNKAVLGYHIEQRKGIETTWMRITKERLSDTSYLVENLDEDEEYQFRIIAQSEVGESKPSEPSQPIKAKETLVEKLTTSVAEKEETQVLTHTTRDEKVTSTPLRPIVKSVTSESAVISWEEPIFESDSPLSGYYVEKRRPASSRWMRVTKKSIINTTYEVPDLIEGEEYEFRVIAESEDGETITSIPTKPILATQVSVEKVEEVTLPARNDETIIKDEVTVKTIDNFKETARVRELIVRETGDGYKDEVVTVREESIFRSKLSQGQDTIEQNISNQEETIHDISYEQALHFGKDSNQYQVETSQITVEKGETLTLEVPLSGSPPPDVSWSCNNVIIQENSRIIPETTEDMAILKIKDVEKEDSGVYVLTMENEIGKVEIPIQVQVLGAPSEPANVKLVEATPDSITIEWETPKDDGGSKTITYNVEKRMVGRRMWQKIDTTEENIFTVPNLIEYNEYEFRICAENEYGVSEPMEIGPILTTFSYATPEVASTPILTAVTEDSATIKWQPPEDDGGSPITGYHIEKRSRTNPQWIRVTKAKINTCSYEVTDLSDDEDYEFRVIAVNKAGESQPSHPSESICTQDQFVAFPSEVCEISPEAEINLQTAKETVQNSILEKVAHQKAPTYTAPNEVLTFEQGETLVLAVPFGGEPVPSVNWSFEDQPLNTTYRVKTETLDNVAILKIKEVDKEDSGIYTLTLENEVTKTDIPVAVKILDVPDIPMNLKIVEATPESISISWETPKEDGGSQVIDYVVEKRAVGRLAWQKVAQTQDNTFTIPNLVEDHDYEIRVCAENKYGASEGAEIGPVKATYSFVAPDTVTTPLITKVTRDSATIKWQAPKDGGSPITGYHIEKRSGTNPQWIRVTKEKINTSSYEITDLTEGDEYQFRVVAENKAGESQPSQASIFIVTEDQSVSSVTEEVSRISESPAISEYAQETIQESQLETVDKRKAPTYTLSEETTTIERGDTLVLEVPFCGEPLPSASWSFAGEPLISAYRVKTETLDNVASLKIHQVDKDDAGIYTLTLENNLTKTDIPITVKVLDVPDFPPNLKLVDATPESVTIEWETPDDSGSDIIGYTVEKRGVGRRGWQTVALTRENTFTIPNLIEDNDYEFRVCAENEYGIGEGSEIGPIKATYLFDIPDVTTAPIVTEVTSNSATIKWQPPRSDGGSPISGYFIEKRTGTSPRWIRVTKDKINTSSFKITDLIEDESYQFRVIAVNNAGESEPSQASRSIIANDVSASTEETTLIYEDIKEVLDTTKDIPQKLLIKTVEKITDSSVVEQINRFSDDEDIESTREDIRKQFAEEIKQKNISSYSNEEITTFEVSETSFETAKEIIQQTIVQEKTITSSTEEGNRFVEDSKISFESIQETIQEKVIEGKVISSTEEVTQLIEDSKIPIKTIESLQEKIYEKGGKGQAPSYTLPAKIMTVEKGQTLVLEVPFSGEPVPSVTWSFAEEPLVSGYRIKTEIFDDTAILKIKEVDKDDSGVYTLILENDVNKTEVPITVKVLDIPDIPQNLKLVESTPESVTIEWEVPQDDRGSQITCYNIEKRGVGRRAWQKVAKTQETNFTIGGLIDGHEYEFRVCAENKYGPGDGAEIGPLKAAFSFDVPGAAGSPIVVGFTSSSATIKWQPPASDGGNPFIGYHIEKRSGANPQWIRVTREKINTSTYNLTDLIEGEEYQFRVIAENRAGEGKPSEASISIIAEDQTEALDTEEVCMLAEPIQAPLVTAGEVVQELFKDAVGKKKAPTYTLSSDVVCVEKGQTLVLEVPFAGEPIPKVRWYFVDEELITAQNVTIEVLDNVATLTVRKMDKENAGVYTLMLKNDVSMVKVPIAVKLLDVPDEPTDVEVVEATPDSITLRWKPPINDNGSPVSSYIVEKKVFGRRTWQKLATPVDTNFTARDLIDSHQYSFQLTAVNKYGPGKPSEIGPVTAQYTFTVPGSPDSPYVTNVTSNSATIKWKPPKENGGSAVLGYHIERHNLSSPRWIRVTKERTTDTTFVSTDLIEDDEYEFRVIAENKAGESQPSQPSKPIIARDTFDELWEEEEDLKTCEENIETTSEETYKVLDKLTSEGVSADVTEEERLTYQKVIITDQKVDILEKQQRFKEEDNLSFSDNVFSDEIEEIETIQPGKAGVIEEIEIQETRILTTDDICETCVNISAPEEIFEQTSESTVEGFPQFSIEKDSVLVEKGDTLKLQVQYSGSPQPAPTWYFGNEKLNESYRIKIRDEDNFATVCVREVEKEDEGIYKLALINEHGRVDIPITVQVLDAPLAPCNIKVVETSPEFMVLEWQAPTDNGGSDITGYLIEKRGSGRKSWQKVATTSETTFTVPDLIEGNHYEFQVSAINKYGQGEPAFIGPVAAEYNFVVPEAPQAPTVSDVTANSAVISWKHPEDDGGSPVLGYHVEKRMGISPRWIRVTKDKIEGTSFKIPDLIEDEEYEFRIIAENKAGQSTPSQPSKPIIAKDTFVEEIDESHYPDEETLEEFITPSKEQPAYLREKSEPEDLKEVVPTETVKLFETPKVKAAAPQFTLETDKVVLEAGETLNVRVLFSGSPHPEAEWSVNGNPLEESKRTKIINTDSDAYLQIKVVEAPDAGIYTLNLTNAHGTIDVPITVTVLDVPSSPSSLQVTEVTNESVTLKWNAPSDDGGSEIIGYTVEKRLFSRQNWQKVTDTTDTSFTVPNLIENNDYEFQVYAINKFGNSEPAYVGPITAQYTFAKYFF